MKYKLRFRGTDHILNWMGHEVAFSESVADMLIWDSGGELEIVWPHDYQI